MSQIERVSKEVLVKKLMAIVGSTFATLVCETDVKMNKRNNPYYGKVKKITRANVNINFNYQNAVNAQRVREGKEADFEAKPRVWGNKVPGTPLILHNGEYYLEARFLGYEKTSTAYFHETENGTELIDVEVLKPFLPAKNESKTQDLENEIVMRDFKITSVKEVLMKGSHYIVK